MKKYLIGTFVFNEIISLYNDLFLNILLEKYWDS